MRSPLARASRLTVPALAVIALTACASGGSAPSTETVGTQSPQRVDIRTMGQREGTSINVVPSAVEADARPIDATPVNAWAAVTWVYNDLKLSPDNINSQTMTIGVENARLRNALGGKPLSWYLDCGMGPSGPNANIYEVMLTARTQVKAVDSTHTQLLTVVTGSARPVSVSGSVVNCNTTGALEKRIAEMATAHAKQK